MNRTISEKLSYSTIRIECVFKDGSTGTGTGFFFNFLENKETGAHIPVIVTNKHIVEGAVKGRILLTKADENNEPLDTQHLTVEFEDFQNMWTFHNDSVVDLCAFPIAHLLTRLRESNQNVFYVPLVKELIPSTETIEDTTAIEEILMIGYPNGI